MAFKPIQIVINAKDNASAVFSSLQAKVAAVGAAIATYFGISAFAGVVKGAADFEQAMSRVQAATGATGKEMAALTKAAEDAGANTKFTSTEAAGALENLAKAGLNAGEAIETLPAVLNLAQAADIGLAEASEIVTKAVMGLGLAFSDAARVADVLAKGANATNTSVTGLAQALSYAAPVAQSLGLSLESTVAIIGKFADAGIDASRAGTALNSILSQFSNPASKFREELTAIGITTGDFEKALHQLAAAGPVGSKAILSVGQEAGPALRALLNQGMPALDELKRKLDDAAGSAAATAKVMQDNLNGSLSGLVSAWDTVKNALGTPVLPVLKDGVDQLAAAFRNAVADGTVARFGESIATAFKSGIQFVRDFVATVDFTAVLARMQTFAANTNETLTKIGEYATNAGNVVKLAWGVMTAGIDGAMAVIYKVTEIMVGQFARIQLGAAALIEALSKITFGDLSARYKAAADEIRLSAEATAAASQALGEKAKLALEGSMQGAELAREGWAGVTAAVNDTAKSTDLWALAVANAAAEIERAGKAQAAANVQAQATKKATDDQAAAAHVAREAIAQLRAEYDALVSSGSLTEAGNKLAEINERLRETAKVGKNAAEDLEGAFKNLNMQTTSNLNEMAARTSKAWDTLTAQGVRSAAVLREAFAAYANAAMAAAERQGDAAVAITKNILAAKAAAAGLSIEADRGGQIIVKSMRDAEDATARVGRAAGTAAGGYRDMAAAAAQAAANAKALQAIYDRHRLDDGKDKYKVGDGSDLIGKSRDIRYAAVNETDINQQIAQRYGEEAVGNELARKAWELRMQLQAYQTNYGNARSAQSLLEQRNIAAELDRVERLLNAVLNGEEEPGRGRSGTSAGGSGSGSGTGGGQGSTPGGAIGPVGGGMQSGGRGVGGSAGGAGNGSGGSGGVSPGLSGPPQFNFVINANGINDPVKLAKLLEPELQRIAALKR
jgi:TP901 family phage tail tape measure protein